MDSLFSSPELQAALGNLIMAMVTLAVGVLTNQARSYLKTHTSAQQFSLLEQLAASAVDAAEQGAIAGFVTDRKATAIAIVNSHLLSAGIKGVSGEQIDAAIEAAIKIGLNNAFQYDATAPDNKAPILLRDTVDTEGGS